MGVGKRLHMLFGRGGWFLHCDKCGRWWWKLLIEAALKAVTTSPPLPSPLVQSTNPPISLAEDTEATGRCSTTFAGLRYGRRNILLRLPCIADSQRIHTKHVRLERRPEASCYCWTCSVHVPSLLDYQPQPLLAQYQPWMLVDLIYESSTGSLQACERLHAIRCQRRRGDSLSDGAQQRLDLSGLTEGAPQLTPCIHAHRDEYKISLFAMRTKSSAPQSFYMWPLNDGIARLRVPRRHERHLQSFHHRRYPNNE